MDRCACQVQALDLGTGSTSDTMLRGAFLRRTFRSVAHAQCRSTTRGVGAGARAVPRLRLAKSTSSGAGAGASSSAPHLAVGGLASLAAGYAGYSYYERREREKVWLQQQLALAEVRRQEEEKALKPQEEYQHPYDKLPWYKRLFKTVGRILYLSYLFVPCTALGLVTSFSSDESWRKYFIDYLVRTMEAAGSTFQKYGQWISNRPDIFPPDVINAMKGLCNEAPMHSAAETRAEIRQSFGCDVEDLFDEFDWEPIASGTIAQVHKARLKPEHALANGRVDVAVKVRHPGVINETYVDAGILFSLVDVASRFSRAFCVPFQEAEFTTMIQKQINLKWEAYNIWRFRENFRDCRDDEVVNDVAPTADGRSGLQSPTAAYGTPHHRHRHLQESGIGQNQVQFPSIDMRHVSTSVLIEEWVEGTSVQAFFEEVGEGFQRTAELTASAAAGAADRVAEAPAALATAAGSVVAAPAAAARKAAQLTAETKHRIAEAVLHSAFHMFFRDNLVHGDLHGGNVLFDEEEGRVTLIDAGITTALGNKQTTDDFLCFLHGMSIGDAEILTDTLLRLSTLNTANVDDARSNIDTPVPVDLDAVPQRAQLKQEVQNSCEKWIDMEELQRSGKAMARTGGPVPVGDLMGDLLQCMSRNQVALRGDVATTVVTIAMCEGLVRQLDPHIDMLVESVPYIRKYCDYEVLSKFL